MATYIDVAALVGIKISAMGSLSKGNSAYSVPADSYAEVYVLNPTTNISDSGAQDMYANKLIAVGGETVEFDSSGNIIVGGVTVNTFNSASTRVKYIVFTNNQ